MCPVTLSTSLYSQLLYEKPRSTGLYPVGTSPLNTRSARADCEQFCRRLWYLRRRATRDARITATRKIPPTRPPESMPVAPRKSADTSRSESASYTMAAVCCVSVSETASVEANLERRIRTEALSFSLPAGRGAFCSHGQCPLAGRLLLSVAAECRYGPAPGMEDGVLQLQYCGTMSISFQNLETNQP